MLWWIESILEIKKRIPVSSTQVKKMIQDRSDYSEHFKLIVVIESLVFGDFKTHMRSRTESFRSTLWDTSTARYRPPSIRLMAVE